MNKKYIHFGPAIIFVIALVWAMNAVEYKPFGFYIGMALGVLLYAAVPAALFSWLHYYVARNRAKKSVTHSEDTLLDAGHITAPRPNYWYYFSSYVTWLGLLFFLIIVARKSGML